MRLGPLTLFLNQPTFSLSYLLFPPQPILATMPLPRSPAMRRLAFILVASAIAVFLSGHALAADSTAPSPPAESSASPIIVIGFVGGYVHHDNMIHSEVQLAAKIRSAYPAGVYAEVLENSHRKSAYPEIVRLLDADHDGSLTDA